MKKLLPFIIASLVVALSGVTVFAQATTVTSPSQPQPGANQAAGSNNLTSTGFVINLSDLDPLSGSRKGASPVGGVQAFRGLLTSVTDFLLYMIPVIAAISIIIAGYYYIFSAGNSEKTTQGKTIIKWNIIAILVAFFSYTILRIVASFFR